MTFEKPGKIVEQKIFGKSSYERVTLERFRYRERWEKDESYEALKKLQPWPDPADPNKAFARTVVKMIQTKLGLEKDAILFYTAVDSPLDRAGVDGWFEVNVPGLDPMRVTVDITINSDKTISGADLVHEVPENWVDMRDIHLIDKDIFLRYARMLAQDLVLLFKQKGLKIQKGNDERN